MSFWFAVVDFADALLRSSAILLVAVFVHWLMGRQRLSGRHILWSVVFISLLVLPFSTMLVPRSDGGIIDVTDMSIALLPEGVDSPGGLQAVTAESGFSLLLALYLIGACATGLWFVVGWWHARRLVNRSEPIDYKRFSSQLGSGNTDLRICISEEAAVPHVIGVFRPVLLLPSRALNWNEKTLAAVLSHELVHIRRRDLLWRAIAQAACCLHWFNPLAWLALRTLLTEQELACDDAVIRSGVKPTLYARAMLAVASDAPQLLAGAAMGRPPRLSERVSRILAEPARSTTSRWISSVIAALLLCVLSGAASVKLFRDDVAESMNLSNELAQFKLQMAVTRNQQANNESQILMKRKAEEMAAQGMSKEEIARALKLDSTVKQKPAAASVIKTMPDKTALESIEQRAQRLFELKKSIGKRKGNGAAQPVNQ